MISKTNKPSDKEPDWMNPENDRKTPFTEVELDTFVEGFILGLDDQEWLSMKSQHGEQKAREIIKTAIGKRDENNLANMTPKGPIN